MNIVKYAKMLVPVLDMGRSKEELAANALSNPENKGKLSETIDAMVKGDTHDAKSLAIILTKLSGPRQNSLVTKLLPNKLTKFFSPRQNPQLNTNAEHARNALLTAIGNAGSRFDMVKGFAAAESHYSHKQGFNRGAVAALLGTGVFTGLGFAFGGWGVLPMLLGVAPALTAYVKSSEADSRLGTIKDLRQSIFGVAPGVESIDKSMEAHLAAAKADAESKPVAGSDDKSGAPEKKPVAGADDKSGTPPVVAADDKSGTPAPSADTATGGAEPNRGTAEPEATANAS